MKKAFKYPATNTLGSIIVFNINAKRMFQLAEHFGQIILECLINGLWYQAKIRKAVLPFAIICQS